MRKSPNFKILNYLNREAELDKFDKKAMLSSLVRDANFQTWDAYVSLDWKSSQ